MNLDLGSLGPSPMKTRSGKAQKEKKVEMERVSIMGNKMCRYYNYKLIVVLHLNFCYCKKNFVQIKTKSKKKTDFIFAAYKNPEYTIWCIDFCLFVRTRIQFISWSLIQFSQIWRIFYRKSKHFILNLTVHVPVKCKK